MPITFYYRFFLCSIPTFNLLLKSNCLNYLSKHLLKYQLYGPSFKSVRFGVESTFVFV